METEVKEIKTVDIWPNEGQISGLPKNPRFIKDERFLKLVKSIIDAPEMLRLRELLITPYAEKYVAIGGNMRLRACVHIQGMSNEEFNAIIEEKQNLENFNDWFSAISNIRNDRTIICKVLPVSTPLEKLREYAIKDNIAFGSDDFDILANEWDEKELEDWGFEMPDFSTDVEDVEEKPATSVVKLTVEFSNLDEYNEAVLKFKEVCDEYFPSAKVIVK